MTEIDQIGTGGGEPELGLRVSQTELVWDGSAANLEDKVVTVSGDEGRGWRVTHVPRWLSAIPNGNDLVLRPVAYGANSGSISLRGPAGMVTVSIRATLRPTWPFVIGTVASGLLGSLTGTLAGGRLLSWGHWWVGMPTSIAFFFALVLVAVLPGLLWGASLANVRLAGWGALASAASMTTASLVSYYTLNLLRDSGGRIDPAFGGFLVSCLTGVAALIATLIVLNRSGLQRPFLLVYGAGCGMLCLCLLEFVTLHVRFLQGAFIGFLPGVLFSLVAAPVTWSVAPATGARTERGTDNVRVTTDAVENVQ